MNARGSILVVVLVTIIFAATALVAFLDKASNDLLVSARVIVSNRLRMEAYSALEVTLGVLDDFRQADGGLRTPAEGWGSPLNWAGWSPSPGHTVEVSFQDESGKIPLIRANSALLVNVFENWSMRQTDAQHLADVLLTWMQQDYVAAVAPSPDYEQSALPYDPPLRPLRTYDELQDIDYARTLLYDADGRRNARWWRFVSDFSLYNFQQPNINAANPDVLAGAGQYAPSQQQDIADYLAGKGSYAAANPLGVQWFQSATQVQTVTGAQGTPANFGTTIAALRILITVHEGSHSEYRLAAVVAPPGGASTVQTTATDVKKGAATSASGATAAASTTTPTQPSAAPTSAQSSAAAAANLQYPFTLLEIRENDEILVPPALPPS